MANIQSAAAASADLITVQASRTAYSLIQQHGARLAAAIHAVVPVTNGPVTLSMSEAAAEDLDEWTLDMWKGAKGGVRKTLTGLSTSITAALRKHRTRDCIPDPGLKAIREANEGGTRLSPGDVVLDLNNELVQVLEGPGFFRVLSEDGIHSLDDGRRYDWRYGHMTAKCKDGGIAATKKYCSPIHELWAKDGSGQTHLKLVHDADACWP
ncbi:hypothetical protein [Paraburkholderia phosphatilytica]|uniref:hypothetical protein n=1 Tax=Paraburkholderia phosphatilytica TaxID=2282883 RepID=UPI000E4C35BB|nr:hypothetical protein [Paraburkholderia phosphatilytica]